MKLIPFFFLLLLCYSLEAQHKTENVILITLDGMRWQEVFSGAEKKLIVKKFGDSAQVVRNFWNDSPERRSELLMPFFWNTIRKEGQLYGNRSFGNKVNVTNEIGRAHV